jgi:hypothetical protein
MRLENISYQVEPDSGVSEAGFDPSGGVDGTAETDCLLDKGGSGSRDDD